MDSKTKCPICGKMNKSDVAMCSACGTQYDFYNDTEDEIIGSKTYTDANGHEITEYIDNDKHYVSKKTKSGILLMRKCDAFHKTDILKNLGHTFKSDFYDNNRKCQVTEYNVVSNQQVIDTGLYNASPSGTDRLLRLDVEYFDSTKLIAYSSKYPQSSLSTNDTCKLIRRYSIPNFEVSEYSFVIDTETIYFIQFVNKTTQLLFQIFYDSRITYADNTSFITEKYDNNTITYQIVSDTRNIIQNTELSNQLLADTKNQTIKLI
jgi:hypothetical protein